MYISFSDFNWLLEKLVEKNSSIKIIPMLHFFP